MKTRTIRYGYDGGVELTEVDVHDPGPGEVQIRTSACGICAADIFVYKHGNKNNFIAGHEGVGRVAKVGAGVNNVREGDRVAGYCLGFAGVANLPQHWVYKLPESTMADEHWIVEPVACVVNGLDQTHLQAGERVVLIGCGFMGLMLMQGLGRCWADEVIAIDVDDRRLELARKFGATRTYNSARPEFQQQKQEIRSMWIDTVIDASGSQAGLNMSCDLVKTGGRISQFGWVHGSPTIPADRWHLEGLTVINSAPNSAKRETWGPAIRLMQRGILDLRPLVTDVVTLDEYPELLAKVVAKQNGYIKGVVKVG